MWLCKGSVLFLVLIFKKSTLILIVRKGALIFEGVPVPDFGKNRGWFWKKCPDKILRRPRQKYKGSDIDFEKVDPDLWKVKSAYGISKICLILILKMFHQDQENWTANLKSESDPRKCDLDLQTYGDIDKICRSLKINELDLSKMRI